MGAADRTIQHLHLRAPSAQAAVLAVYRLEDALRCASLPDAGERVLLVRRLHLGRLPEGLSPQSLSLMIEQRVAALGGEWVHGGDARAAASDTVFFEGRWQAASTALEQRARGLPLTAWYWRGALPGVSLQGELVAFVWDLWRCMERDVAAPACRSAFVADAVARRCGDVVVRWLFDGASEEGEAAPMQEPPLLAIDGAQTGRDFIRYSHPHRIDVPRHWPAALHGHLRAAGWHAQDTLAGTDGTWLRGGNPFTTPEGEHSVANRQGSQAMPVGDENRDPTRATVVGGLLFLLPVLQTLKFDVWQARFPDQDGCAAVLRRALMHLCVPGSDPAWAMVDSLPCGEPPAPDGDGEAAWLDRCRRHLYRAERLSLARLCLRPAHLRWSATHLEVMLDARQVDIRVRRQGLDLDPGWVPWLGRVVTFNY